MKINMPEDVKYILNVLKSHNYEGYIVGGCVRDALLNKNPKDWDITTNATPDQVKRLFSHVIPTGEQHGTVTVMLNHEGYEVTTYRTDGEYSDGRRPDSVTFTKSLKEDVSRRDFTINSMAYNDDEGLIDYYNGHDDLLNKIIRCVGNDEKRFSEDYLRVVRAYRFAITYGFTLNEETYRSCKDLLSKKCLRNLSKERLQMELDKMLLSSGYINRQQFNLLLEIFMEIMKEVLNLEDFCERNENDNIFGIFRRVNRNQRLAVLLYNYVISTQKSSDAIKNIKYSNEMHDYTINLIINYNKKIEDTFELKGVIRQYGFDFVKDLLDLQYYVSWFDSNILYSENLVRELINELHYIKQNNEVINLNQLDINGNDLMNILNIPAGKKIGLILEILLSAVIHKQVENNQADLIKYVTDNCLKEN